jgi:hypothetical protein
MIAFVAAGLFANGQKDNDTDNSFRGDRPYREDGRGGRAFRDGNWGEGGYCFDDNQEVLELTGNLELINGEPPYLLSDGERYVLRAPYRLLRDIDIENGQDVNVSGYEVPAARWQWDDSEKGIHVLSAEIDGEEYDLSEYRYGGFGCRGGRGGRGPGRW